MIISHIYDYALTLCGINAWQVNSLYPMIAWSFDTGNYAVMAVDGQWAMAFWCFCNESDIESIKSYDDYVKVLSKRQISGDVIIPYLVCGRIRMIHKEVFRKIMKDRKVKKMLFYKTKTCKFYTMEV